MPNRRSFDAIGGQNFNVEIEGVTEGPFIAVQFLKTTTAVVEMRSGNDAIVRKTPGRHSYGNIVLRRLWNGDDALWTWRKHVLDGQVTRKAGSVLIYNALAGTSGSEIARYNFFEAWPCGWQLGPWDAQTDGTLVEEVELAVEKIELG